MAVATESSPPAMFRRWLPEPLGSSPQVNHPTKKAPQRALILLAASPGLEPRLTESESAVLPLDDEALIHLRLIYGKKISLSITLFYFAIYKIRNKQKRYC